MQSGSNILYMGQLSNTANHARPLILLMTHVVLVRVACGSKLIPALYEKAQAPEKKAFGSRLIPALYEKAQVPV